MWQNLAVAAFHRSSGKASVVESVHLCDYPAGDPAVIDERLSERMALVREIVSLGHSARMGASLKVRQPLALLEVVLPDTTHHQWLEEHAALICDELNVKQVEIVQRADQYITYTVLAELKRLGPRLGKRLPALRKVLAAADAGKVLAELEGQGKVTLELPDGPVTLDSEDLQVRLQAKEGWAAAQGRQCVVVLATQLTEDLVREGLARETARVVNDRRKEMNCRFTDRIEIGIVTASPELRAAIEQFRQYIMGETLATRLDFSPIDGAETVAVKVGEFPATLHVRVMT
jgi:isoleucyl-tRNA synthetase